MIRVAAVHLDAELVTAVIDRFADNPARASAVARLDLADVDQRRRAGERAGWRTGRSVLEQFGIPLPLASAA
jgi:hypothetical protein